MKNCVAIGESVTQSLYSAKQVREQEGAVAHHCGLNLWQLMEKAGVSAFELLQEKYPAARSILLLVGKGNNAGDAFILGQQALDAGLKVNLLSPFGELHQQLYQGDALTAFRQFESQASTLQYASLDDLSKSDVLIDGLLGTGFRPPLADDYAQIIAAANHSKVPILSLDLPSGLHADTGTVEQIAIKAQHTITFVAVKAGLLTGVSADHCGKLWFADLTIGRAFAERVKSNTLFIGERNLPALKPRKASSHKGDTGFVFALAGNQGYPGAARLASEAALRAGAGMVAVSTHADNQQVVIAGRPELILAGDNFTSAHFKQLCDRASAILVGPGLGQGDWAQAAWQCALSQNKAMVVDADALNLLAQSPVFRDNWILTPHPGEAARLLGCSISEVNKDRFAAAKNIQLKYGGICLLKGAGTMITDGLQLSINTSGNQGMASAGMGDVLSGIIAALFNQSENLLAAAQVGCYLHGKAADFQVESGVKGLLASDLFDAIRHLVNDYSEQQID